MTTQVQKNDRKVYDLMLEFTLTELLLCLDFTKRKQFLLQDNDWAGVGFTVCNLN
jgi:hypothetical protein